MNRIIIRVISLLRATTAMMPPVTRTTFLVLLMLAFGAPALMMCASTTEPSVDAGAGSTDAGAYSKPKDCTEFGNLCDEIPACCQWDYCESSSGSCTVPRYACTEVAGVSACVPDQCQSDSDCRPFMQDPPPDWARKICCLPGVVWDTCGECPVGAICDSGLVMESNVPCADCLGANCCAQVTACADNANCLACATGKPTAVDCGNDALLGAMNTCLQANCATECQ